ncbi:MAG: response regulator transcription factor [Elusimicrobia bacterium]|nr:response regulator transcription factor [Elusimicrobiota bacterium]
MKETTPQKTALIVDDDKELSEILVRYLGGRGFAVLTAKNGAEGFKTALAKRPDLVITDVEMPLMDGFALCKKIKDSQALANIPVIIMSGKKISDLDQVSGYGLGADDYVTKPFSYQVLLAKAKALLRRVRKNPVKAAKIKKAGLEIDIEGRSAKLKGRALKLTSKEFDILVSLVSKECKVLTFNVLLETVWGHDLADYNDPHTVEVHISNLRKKLGLFGKRIKAVAGHGYKFE